MMFLNFSPEWILIIKITKSSEGTENNIGMIYDNPKYNNKFIKANPSIKNNIKLYHSLS